MDRPPEQTPGPGSKRAPDIALIVLMAVLVAVALWFDRDRHDPVSDAYGVSSYPAPLVIDAEGIVGGMVEEPGGIDDHRTRLAALVAGQ